MNPYRKSYCGHFFEDGAGCLGVAESESLYCRWHKTSDDRRKRLKRSHSKKKTAIQGLHIPNIEDCYSLQLGLQSVMDAIIDGRIKDKQAGLLLYALRVSRWNVQGQMNFSKHRWEMSDYRDLRKDDVERRLLERATRMMERHDAARARSTASTSELTLVPAKAASSQ